MSLGFFLIRDWTLWKASWDRWWRCWFFLPVLGCEVIESTTLCASKLLWQMIGAHWASCTIHKASANRSLTFSQQKNFHWPPQVSQALCSSCRYQKHSGNPFLTQATHLHAQRTKANCSGVLGTLAADCELEGMSYFFWGPSACCWRNLKAQFIQQIFTGFVSMGNL